MLALTLRRLAQVLGAQSDTTQLFLIVPLVIRLFAPCSHCAIDGRGGMMARLRELVSQRRHKNAGCLVERDGRDVTKTRERHERDMKEA